MKNSPWLLYGALALLYVLHNDWWLWDDATVVLGLPVGLTYHVIYMVVTSLVMFLLVRFAWPHHLSDDSRSGDER